MKKRFYSLRLMIVLLVLAMTAQGCVRYRPQTNTTYLDRAQTKTDDGGITVTVSALTGKESHNMFGVPLGKKRIQPVWVKIENKTDQPYIFLVQSLDVGYFSAQEASYMNHHRPVSRIFNSGIVALAFAPLLVLAPISMWRAKAINQKMDAHFAEYAFPTILLGPQSIHEGFVFTNMDEGSKAVRIELVGKDSTKDFDFFLNVPGLKFDYQQRDFRSMYSPEQVEEYNKENINVLLDKIERMPCCTTDKKGTIDGDPLNLVFVGNEEDIINAFKAAGWDETEVLNAKTSWKMFKAFLNGAEYRYSPMSALYLEGRSQDIGLQQIRESINERLHLRLWYTPYRVNDRPVWIGTVSRDIGLRFTRKSWYLMTHKIDSDVDEARDNVFGTLYRVKRIKKFGFVRGTPFATKDQPIINHMNDKYYSDGLRLVVGIADTPGPMDDNQWEFLMHLRERNGGSFVKGGLVKS